MITVFFKPKFIRQFNTLETGLQDEVLQKIELFKNPRHHATLRVHKLHGPLKEFFSFSVDYRTRIVFAYEDRQKTTAALLAVGNHDVYQ